MVLASISILGNATIDPIHIPYVLFERYNWDNHTPTPSTAPISGWPATPKDGFSNLATVGGQSIVIIITGLATATQYQVPTSTAVEGIGELLLFFLICWRLFRWSKQIQWHFWIRKVQFRGRRPWQFYHVIIDFHCILNHFFQTISEVQGTSELTVQYTYTYIQHLYFIHVFLIVAVTLTTVTNMIRTSNNQHSYTVNTQNNIN